MQVAGLRGGGYFTHFRVAKIVGFAGSVVERTHPSIKMSFCNNILNSAFGYNIKSRGRKNSQPRATGCKVLTPHKFIQR